MNHRKFGIKLGRNRREREALFKSLVRSVFTHGTIETTEAKAKSVVSIIEKLANHIATKDKLVAQRELSTYIQDKLLVSQMYSALKVAFPDQTSNFTTMSRVKIRQGDDALIVKFGFVKPYKLEVKTAEPKKEVKKTEAKETTKISVKKATTKSSTAKARSTK